MRLIPKALLVGGAAIAIKAVWHTSKALKNELYVGPPALKYPKTKNDEHKD